MKKLLIAGIAWVAIFGTPALKATPSGPLYIDDNVGNIGTVNLATDKVSILGYAGVTLTDIGFTADGDLYGTDFSNFYSINKTTGAATLISSYKGAGDGGMNALVGAGSDLFAASTSDDDLFRIDPTSFSITALTGSTKAASAGDLAIESSGLLYEADVNGDLEKLTVTGDSFTASIVGSMGNDGIVGLATGDDGVTYAVSEDNTEIYTLDLSTAELTPFLDYGGQGLEEAFGQAFLAEADADVPEPGSWALLALGVGGIAFYRRMKLVPALRF